MTLSNSACRWWGIHSGLPLILILTACSAASPSAIPSGETSVQAIMTEDLDTLGMINPGFESEGGWIDLTVEDSEYFAPVEGQRYGTRVAGSAPLSQIIDHTITTGETYTLTLWARSIYDPDHIESLRAGDGRYPWGNPARAIAEVELWAGSTEIAWISQDVSPISLSGAPQRLANDDGGNVWIDGGWRHAFADYHFIQPLGSDPLLDPWRVALDSRGYRNSTEDQLAVAPVIIGDRKAIFLSSTDGLDQVFESQIGFIEVFDRFGLGYDWSASGPARDQQVILTHVGDEDPIAFDPHVLYDEETGRLWMTWGGGRIWVSELDPDTGRLLSDPPDLEFNTHGPGVHTEVARWQGDVWTGDNEWIEGGALWKQDGYWYLFASYGNLGENYTIRMGRSSSPTGPFIDKAGIPLTDYDPRRERYGSSFLLGDDGDQLVPGHPHLWREADRVYLGYDYRHRKGLEGLPGSRDTFGIRELHWVDGWPTVWHPITLRFKADDHPEAIGQKVEIFLNNGGEAGSVVAFDRVEIRIE